MSRLPGLSDLAAREGLFVAGVAPLRPEDAMPERFRSVALPTRSTAGRGA